MAILCLIGFTTRWNAGLDEVYGGFVGDNEGLTQTGKPIEEREKGFELRRKDPDANGNFGQGEMVEVRNVHKSVKRRPL